MRYCHVRTGETGPEACDPDLGAQEFGVDQDMQCSGGGPTVTCSTVLGTHPLIATDSRENAFAIQIHLRRTSVPGHPDCSNDPTFGVQEPVPLLLHRRRVRRRQPPPVGRGRPRRSGAADVHGQPGADDADRMAAADGRSRTATR